jgi:hypothetical protein
VVKLPTVSVIAISPALKTTAPVFVLTDATGAALSKTNCLVAASLAFVGAGKPVTVFEFMFTVL